MPSGNGGHLALIVSQMLLMPQSVKRKDTHAHSGYNNDAQMEFPSKRHFICLVAIN